MLCLYSILDKRTHPPVCLSIQSPIPTSACLSWSCSPSFFLLISSPLLPLLHHLVLLQYVNTNACLCVARKVMGDVEDDPALAGPEDDDVAAERMRIQADRGNNSNSSNNKDDAIVIQGLRKVYDARLGAKPHVAVADLYYRVRRGECFGFLGANGAGKTTAIKILTGDMYPTKGTATLNGFDIVNQPYEVRQHIGYCPQFDALMEFMTGREHLELFARIKCVPETKLKTFVDYMLDKLTLTDIADKPAGTYSGGNKRKLSVGIALIGNPPIVFLDEPSTGMDPQARRFMWQLISTTMKNRSVILTTHSMEECEALCDRIGIMTNGRLQCLGTSQHLKSKFGRGYQISVKAVDGAQATVKAFVGATFARSMVLEEHGQNLRFRITRESARSVSHLFRTFEQERERAGILAYSVSETDLEQLFIQFVKEGEERREAYERRNKEITVMDSVVLSASTSSSTAINSSTSESEVAVANVVAAPASFVPPSS